MDTEQPVQQPANYAAGRDWKRILKTLLVIVVLLAIGAAAGWYWRDTSAKDVQSAKQAEITSLQNKVTKLEKDVADAKVSTSTTSGSSVAQSKSPSASVLESIQASVTSGNAAALESYMASTVRVILAASEGVGDRTPVQAINDLKYIEDADAWDFALPAATLSKYQAGDYKQYFPTTALVGQSANNYVVSFQFDSSAKISGIFMTSSSDLL